MGRGVGRLANVRIVFFDGTMPGDVFNVNVNKSTGTYIEAQFRDFVSKSKNRIDPPCQHADKCSGCSLQFVPYEQQLDLKYKSITSRLRRALDDPSLPIDPIVGSPRTQGFRNKVEFSFSPDADGTPRAGFIDRDASGVVDIENCLLSVPLVNDILKYVKEKALEVDMDFGGQIRRLTIKTATKSITPAERAYADSDIMTDNATAIGDTSTEIMVIVVFRFVDKKARKLMEMVGNRFMGKAPKVTEDRMAREQRLARERSEAERKKQGGFWADWETATKQNSGRISHTRPVDPSQPRVTSLYMSTNKNTGRVVPELTQHELYRGDAHIVQQMEHLTFQIFPASFFQPNPEQAVVIYRLAREMAQLTGSENVYDLYTGTGTIGLFLAPYARKVVGVDYVPESIESAKVNARDNNISNAQFYAGDMSKTLNKRFIRKHGVPDVVVADPPRQGMAPEVVKTIRECAPQRIVYVSCDGATLARDLKMLCAPAEVSSVAAAPARNVDLDSIPTEAEALDRANRAEAEDAVPLVQVQYRVKRVVPVDQFPHSAHYETVVLLERVDAENK